MKAIIRGISKTVDATQLVHAIQEEEYDAHLLMTVESSDGNLPGHDPASTAKFDSSLPIQGGGECRIRYEPCHFRDFYVDEYTREKLPQDLVKAAIVDELN